MKIHTADKSCIAFSLRNDEHMSKSEAEDFVNSTLKMLSLPAWEEISLEVFAGKNESLYLARPINSLKISISPLLLSMLGEYFTE